MVKDLIQNFLKEEDGGNINNSYSNVFDQVNKKKKENHVFFLILLLFII